MREDVGDRGEVDGGGGAVGGFREPEEAVGGEDEEAGFEVREPGVGFVFAEKVDAGEEEALDLVR